MDPRERLDDREEAIRAALDGRQAALWTALPGILQSFNATAMTCTVQPSVQGVQRNPDGTVQPITGGAQPGYMPILVDCPVQFQSGGGCALSFPLAMGDEGLIIIASRCIDGWWQSGGVQPQAEQRMHDLSDGFFIPGVWSQPRVKPMIGMGARLATVDGSVFVDVHAGGIASQGAWTHTGTLTASGDIMAGTISLESHVHTGVQPGTGITGPAQG